MVKSFTLRVIALIFGIIALSDSAFSQTVTADFVADNTAFCNKGIVRFTNASKNAQNFLWNFGNGTTSTLENPSTTYSKPGKYTVKLIVADASGAKDVLEIVDYIQVFPSPATKIFTEENKGCAPFTALLADSSRVLAAPISSWKWSFGNTDTSIEQHPDYTFNKAGLYRVRLFTTDTNGCHGMDSTMIMVNPSPKADFGYFGRCTGDSIALFDKTLGANLKKWVWVINNTDTLMGRAHKVKADTAGTYSVGLYVVNDSMCSDTIIRDITIFDSPVISGHAFIDTAGKIPLRSGFVALLAHKDSTARFKLIDTVHVDTTGYYEFRDIPAISYVVLAHPNRLKYRRVIPTYYDHTKRWPQAHVFTTDCDSTYQADIHMLKFPKLTGRAKVRGRIVNRLSQKNGQTEGDPVPDVDVTLEQIPGNEIVAVAETDEQGYYEFDSIPEGTYQLHVDIPGLEMDSTHEVNVGSTEQDTAYNDLDFVVDSVIDVGDSTITRMEVDFASGNHASIFPNPFLAQTTIKYTLAQATEVKIEVYDILGNQVDALVRQKQSAGSFEAVFKSPVIAEGIYFVRIQLGTEVITKRIVQVR